MALMVGRGGRRAGSQAAWSHVLGNADVLKEEDWRVGGFCAGVEALKRMEGASSPWLAPPGAAPCDGR